MKSGISMIQDIAEERVNILLALSNKEDPELRKRYDALTEQLLILCPVVSPDAQEALNEVQNILTETQQWLKNRT